MICLVIGSFFAFWMCALRLMRKEVPMRLITVHALFGVTAFVILCVDTMTRWGTPIAPGST